MSGPGLIWIISSIVAFAWGVYALILKKDKVAQQANALKLIYYLAFLTACGVLIWATVAFLYPRIG